MSDTDRSKFLSYILRHAPEAAGITLDPGGWTDADALLSAMGRAGHPTTRAELEALVRASDKKRFTLVDGRIRAAQGHSVEVELGLSPVAPPAVLFHGTATRFLDAIRAEGLTPQSRRLVHLSADADTARAVGARHGKPVVLEVSAAGMQAAGAAFFQAENGVWLTAAVAPAFLRFPDG